MTTQDPKTYLSSLIETLDKEKKKTFDHWVFLSNETKVNKLLRDLFTRKCFKKISLYENTILELLELSHAKVFHRNRLQKFTDLHTMKSTTATRSNVYFLYLRKQDSRDLKPGIIEEFIQIHQKMNIILNNIRKMHDKD